MQCTMFHLLVVTLLLGLTQGALQMGDDRPISLEEADHPAIPWSEEATTKRLNLEDPASWSASTEVLDENHAWYRRKRSLERSGTDAAEDMAKDDLATAESVLFIPSHLRSRKKLAHEECRKGHREFVERKRTGHHVSHSRHHCNNYCCYPVV